jgi:hypothetical protein
VILRFSVRVNLTVLIIITKFDKYSSKLGFFDCILFNYFKKNQQQTESGNVLPI